MILKKTMALLLSLALLFCAAGCAEAGKTNGDNDQTTQGAEVDMELTQRQKDILVQMGLPDDAAALSESQREAIEAIETMLTYLEERYAQEFCYYGYVAKDHLEQEHLLAYPASGGEWDVVTVYRTYVDGEACFEDDYALLQARPYVETELARMLAPHLDLNGVAAFCDILDVQGEVSDGTAAQCVSANVYLYIDAGACTMEQFEAAAEACGQWLRENCNGMPSSVMLLLTDTREIQRVNWSNYQEMLLEDIFSAQAEYMVSADGELFQY